jgi:hypothetical protein
MVSVQLISLGTLRQSIIFRAISSSLSFQVYFA